MKKMYLALVALGLALGANAQTWVLTNTGATQHLYTCAAAAKSATDFYVWTAGEGHTTNSRKFANGTWSQWNDVSIGSPVVNEISIIGFSQTLDPYVAYAFDAQAYLYADGLYTNATPQSVGERILSYSLYTAGGGYAASSTGKVYYPFSSTGNSNSNIGQLSLGSSPIVSVKVSDQLNHGVAVSSAGDIYILTGGNPIVAGLPASYTKTKGLRSLATNGGSIFVAVGDTGTIHKSLDGGDTWTTLNSGTTQNLNGVQVNDANNMMVVGDNGTVLKTTDGGATWTTVSVPTTQHLNDIKDFGLFGVIVGNNGTVLSYGLDASPVACDVDITTTVVTSSVSGSGNCDGQADLTVTTSSGGQPVIFSGALSVTYISGPTSFSTINAANTTNISNLCAGTYQAVVIPTDKNSNEVTCRDTFSFTIGGGGSGCTTPPVPTLTLVGDTIFASTVGVTGGYDWYKDGVILATTNFPVNWIRGYGDGTYTVQAGNGPCVSALSDPLVVNLVGINEVMSLGFEFYPNPASGSITVSSNETIEALEVFNLMGEKVMASIGQTHSIDISVLAVGTYVLQAKSNGASGRKIFIKN